MSKEKNSLSSATEESINKQLDSPALYSNWAWKLCLHTVICLRYSYQTTTRYKMRLYTELADLVVSLIQNGYVYCFKHLAYLAISKILLEQQLPNIE